MDLCLVLPLGIMVVVSSVLGMIVYAWSLLLSRIG